MKTITAPVTVQILTAPPAPESKASAALREREAVAMVLRAALPKNAPRALLSWAADRICGHPIVARNLAGFASMRGHEDADRDGGVLAAERGAS